MKCAKCPNEPVLLFEGGVCATCYNEATTTTTTKQYEQVKCEDCSTIFDKTSKVKRFCSMKCQNRAAMRKRYAKAKASRVVVIFPPLLCHSSKCDVIFTPEQAHQRACSPACRYDRNREVARGRKAERDANKAWREEQ